MDVLLCLVWGLIAILLIFGEEYEDLWRDTVRRHFKTWRAKKYLTSAYGRGTKRGESRDASPGSKEL